jgi:hypothetical protein
VCLGLVFPLQLLALGIQGKKWLSVIDR